ncbi:MAG: Acetyltransferase (GNAT) family protein [Methanomassiliicoccales archaeon PtaU1.Bin124]|nr:MAG: Acetyltransferase (GNAT) family protein [Methanomassiliicoccales archaeon PtaU1.Bin124]
MVPTSEGLVFEKVTPETFPELARHIKGLASYERCPVDDAHIERVMAEAFKEHSCFEGYLARKEGEAVGSIICIWSFSTSKGRPTMVMDHLFVADGHRGKGIGKMLFQFAIGKAVGAGCGRMEWNALEWNTNALKFYQTMGAKSIDGVVYFRMTDADLEHMIE